MCLYLVFIYQVAISKDAGQWFAFSLSAGKWVFLSLLEELLPSVLRYLALDFNLRSGFDGCVSYRYVYMGPGFRRSSPALAAPAVMSTWHRNPSSSQRSCTHLPRVQGREPDSERNVGSA